MRINFESSTLTEQALMYLRDKNTSSRIFRENLRRLGTFLCYEAAKKLDTQKISVDTPVAKAEVDKIIDEVVVLSLLRAAMPMADAVLDSIDNSSLGIISASRSDMIGEGGTAFHINGGYSKIPPLDNKVVFVVDPMLASGSSIKYLLNMIKDEKPKKIVVLVAIASEFGVSLIEENYSEVEIYCGTIDKELNSKGYIVPGLGDAGDRVCNTEH